MNDTMNMIQQKDAGSPSQRFMTTTPLPGKWLAGFTLLGFLLGCFLTGFSGADARAEIVISKESPDKDDGKDDKSPVPDPDGEATPTRYDVIRFLNGDRFRGTFFSIDEEHGVRWRHPAIKQLLEIDPETIAYIALNRPQATNASPKESCLVRLANQDEIMGELVLVDTNHIVLNTWYGGDVRIPRARARAISPGQAPIVAVYEGPDSLDNWEVKTNTGFNRGGRGMGNGWSFRNGAFYCSGNSSIGRDVKLPDKSRIEFELAWNGYLHLAMSIYSAKLQNYGGPCYMLQLNSGSIYLQRMTKSGNSSSLGHAEARSLSRRSKAHLTVLSNREKKTIALLIDGVKVKQWTDRGDFSESSGIGFFQQGQGTIRIRDLRITEWDGKYNDEAEEEGKPKADLVRLENHDKISGELKTIREGKMQFGTEFATLDVPLNRIATIEMAKVEAPEDKPDPRAIRAVFADRGSITFNLTRWDDRQILGKSPNFGDVKFLPSAFTRIEFNLDKDGAASSQTTGSLEEPGLGQLQLFIDE